MEAAAAFGYAATAVQNMRILLIAYHYPPLASPQAIRWYYLTRELARQGASVHVLAPDLPGTPGTSLPVPDGVVVHRCHAGGLAGWTARTRRAVTPGTGAPDRQAPAVRLNWKGRLYRRLDWLISLYCYPDSRGQWLRPARRALDRLIGEFAPDVLISSHEPPATLQLGLAVADRVPVWLADLGDPVWAPYTPRRWRRRALRLERETCRRAAVSVTTEATRQLMIRRHGVDPSTVQVLTQGFDDSLPAAAPAGPARPVGPLHLLYAGRFYPFRSPAALLEAVCAVPGVRLTVVAPEVDPAYLAMARRSGGRIVFLGEQPHEAVLRMQLECDVLVNIGNALEAQIPGKLYEYLGSGKPILHLASTGDDPVVSLIAEWGVGWSCSNTTTAIGELLARMADAFPSMQAQLRPDPAQLKAFGWSGLAEDLLQRCRRLLQAARAD
jgi:glycosyltransferase involved in cell wall biosynthesis